MGFTLAGLALAPALVPRLIEEYRDLYPSVEVGMHGGGSRQALQEIANRHADLAILNRLPTTEELRTISSVVTDSVKSFPIALGGIAVLSARRGGLDSTTVRDLRGWIRRDSDLQSSTPPHFYAPDPNLGIWTALADLLGVDESQEPVGMVWLANEREVAEAVAGEPGSVGVASTLALPRDLDSLGATLVPVRADTSFRAALPSPANIETGRYPLFHQLYLAFLADVGPAAGGFVTFMYSPRGQRLIEREGFLPARHTARIVQLVQKPLG